MTHVYASIAFGTAAALTAMTLLLLRVHLHRRYVLVLTKRWIGAGTVTSIVILAPLAAIAIWGLAAIQGNTPFRDNSATAPSETGDALQPLRAYSDQIADQKAPPHAGAGDTSGDDLPAVDVMVAKLIARLQEQPNDVAGWKMLGWSYLNTNRASEAAEAYQTALKLQPDDAEAQKALKAAQSAMSGVPTPADAAATSAADSGLDENQAAMIRGMVDRLAARLETSPDDEAGWLQLMRSRVVQGERDAAKSALTKALTAFKSNSVVSDRLTAVARELGIDVPAIQ